MVTAVNFASLSSSCHSHWGLGQFFGGGGGLLKFPGGEVKKKRQSPEFRSPEVGISVVRT